jgi:hypothetical protein
MRNACRLKTFSSAILVAVGLIAPLAACTSQSRSQETAEIATDELLLEFACERDLLYLDDIIQKHLSKKTVPLARLLEAQELRWLAGTLYLQREYSLAVKLIEDAVKLLEEFSE